MLKQKHNYLDTFCERLKRRRMYHDYTQMEMAELLDVSYHTYKGYEYGKFYPSVEALYRIAVILNVSTDFLLGLSTGEVADDSRGDLIGVAYWESIKKRLKERKLTTGELLDKVLGIKRDTPPKK
jgi:transcriptional regulator with XRE-family HTH domain